MNECKDVNRVFVFIVKSVIERRNKKTIKMKT